MQNVWDISQHIHSCPYTLSSGAVHALAVFEDKGLASGTDARTFDLFNVSALALHGPRVPFQKLQASGAVPALAVSDDKGLAANTYFTVDLFNVSAFKTTWTQSSFPEASGKGRCLCLGGLGG